MKYGKKSQAYPGVGGKSGDMFQAAWLIIPNQWPQQQYHENIGVKKHFHFSIILRNLFTNGIVKTTSQYACENECIANDIFYAEVNTKNIF